MRLFTVSQRGGYAPMIGGLGYVLASGNAAYKLNTVAAKDVWVLPSTRTGTERGGHRAVGRTARRQPGGTGAVSSPRVLSDLFWTGRYAERAENMATAADASPASATTNTATARTCDASECVPVLLTALGELTGTDTGAAGDRSEMIAIAPTTLWSLTVDRGRSGSLAQSVERLGLVGARGARPDVQRHLDGARRRSTGRCCTPARRRPPPDSLVRGDTADGLGARPHARRDAGAVRGGRRVDGAATSAGR